MAPRNQSRGRHWCFTVNNWTAANDELLKALGAAEGTTYLVYGYEEGENHTPHLQGYICFDEVKRFATVKDMLPAGAHIEKKRGSPQQAADYCKKDGLFNEFGTIPRATSGALVFDDFKEWVLSKYNESGVAPSERCIAETHPALFVRYGRRLQDLVKHLCPHPVIVDKPLRDWQIPLFEALALPCDDDRKILFYVDEAGGKGKSYFQRWMQGFYPDRCQVMGVGKRDDLAHSVEEHKDIFMFNCPRGAAEFLNYSILEMIKDRIVFSPKYESHTKVLQKVPHVVVFMNEPPDESKMTRDRYVIEYI